MSLKDRIINSLEERRENVLNGGINCIPLPFHRFRSEMSGIEQGNYYLITGATKSAKTQITNYLFVYNTVLYTFYNPDIIYPKIFYFPLEETAENITLRFMAFLISHITKGRVKISPVDLKSTDERKPLSKEVLDIMYSNEFCNIMEHYESIVTFYDDRNPTGVWKVMTNYAKTHGETHFKTIKMKEVDDVTGEEKMVDREVFDYYTPKCPSEYIFIIVDHVSLMIPERNMQLRECIAKLSEYMVILRNRYNYIPVIIQQQSVETQSLDAFKQGKIRPTVAGLGDCKYTARDCNVMIGMTNPNSFELSYYYNYKINDGGEGLKDNFRMLEIVLNRSGSANGLCPVFFNGAINEFKELPLPKDKDIEKFYELAENMRKERRAITSKTLINFAKKLFNYVKFRDYSR